MQALGLGLTFEKYAFTLVRTDGSLAFYIVLALLICIPEAARYFLTRGRSYS